MLRLCTKACKIVVAEFNLCRSWHLCVLEWFNMAYSELLLVRMIMV